MEKGIYGLFDFKTHNFGDICILDRDEEFTNGVVELLSNPSIPSYVVSDLLGVKYGYITFDSTDPSPMFHIFDAPKHIICGTSPSVVNRRMSRIKEDSSDEEIEEDS